MKLTIIVIYCVWFVGYILSYLYLRKTFRAEFKKWTIGDRNFALFICIFSWVTLLISFFDAADKNKPAKW